MNNPEMGGFNPEAEGKTFLSVDQVKEKFVWAGSAEYPDRTEDEAWPHVEAYINGNEYVSEAELLEMGFAKKETEESE